MVRIAFLLLCHKNAEQVNALIRRLSSENRDFYVHVDAKSSIYNDINWSDKVFPIQNRVAVQWGDVTMCNAEVALMKAAVESGKQYDYYWLISGQDYPIKTNSEIDDFLSARPNVSYININDKASTSHTDKLKRNEIWYPKNKKSIILRIFIKLYEKISGEHRTYSLFKRKNTLGLEFRFGAQWFCLNSDCMHYVYEYIDSHPQLMIFFNHSVVPDECFVQTVIANSEFFDTVHPMLTYVDWSEGKASPKILNEQDFEKLKNSKKLLARKFEEIPVNIKELSKENI